MKNYKILLQYDGSRYSGWQKQGNTSNTIQGKLEGILEKLTGDYVEIHGSGRTDAGVHALGQVANFKCDTTLSDAVLYEHLNQYLPTDIRIIALNEASSRFHARLNASSKHYRYIIDTNKWPDVFSRKYRTHLPKKYDIRVMQKAAALLLGEHDFKSFCDNKKMKKSTVRTITSLEISEQDNIITMDFYGNGFLYHMVRILVGTLLEVGEGLRDADDIPRIIEAKDRRLAGFTAPAQGLFLVEVFY